MSGYAWITLATNDPYCLGALVLAHSLKRVGTKHDLVILITPGVTSTMREKLNAVFSLVQEVNVLNSQDEANLALLARPELGITFTKLHCWKLTQYEKCVFVDADALVVRNCDELFEREELSAAPDVGWPDCFNSGVFVFKPSQTTFDSLTLFAASKGSFDGGDQGLLNQYFSDWAHKDIAKHLPFIYNMCSTATYSYLPAYKQFGKDVKIIHFIGSTKPWLQYFDSQTRQVHPSSESGHLETLLQHWWNIFCEMVHPQLTADMARSTLSPIWHDSYPRVSTIAFTLSNNILNNSTDMTYDNVNVPIPDFSEFRDPWENYNHEADECNYNHNSDQYILDSNDVENIETQYQSNDNTSYRSRHMNDWESERNSNCDYYDDSKSCLIDKVEKIENYKLTKLHDAMNNFDEYSNQQNSLNHLHSSNEKRENDQNGCITNQHYQYDSSYNDTQYIQSQSAHQYVKKDEILVKVENSHDCENDIVHTDIPTISSQTNSQTGTESESIACQSETNNFDDVAHKNTGIAGALAKMTLGTTRSPEQEAFEQHMRKQSWEQGKIDYMGRDSFDNIWTKICTTIGAVTECESTTPYEKIDQSSTAAQSANVITQAPIGAEVPTLQHAHEAITYARPHENLKEETIESNTSCCENPASAPIVTPSSFSPEIEIGSTMSPTIEIDASKHEESFATNESQATRDSAINSVSIQVAESVLEADIKESVSEDVKPVTEEAISSVSAPIQESISAVMETPLEPHAPARSQSIIALLPPKPNGTAVDTEANQSPELKVQSISQPVLQEEKSAMTVSTCVPTTSPSSSSTSVLRRTPELGKNIKKSEDVVPSIPTASKFKNPLDDLQTVSQSGVYEPSFTQVTTDILNTSEPTAVIAPSVETSVNQNVQSKTIVPDSVSQESKPLVTNYDEDQHKKALPIQSEIPGTPIITEATPPTSPLLDVAASSGEIKKITKKIVKKTVRKPSGEGNETEENRKLTKKINKKASSCPPNEGEEPKEMLEDGSSSNTAGKPKKIIKVKRTTKSVTTLDTTTYAPDTPPPTTSETPIPPKRKVKSVNTKSSTNKLDPEP